MTHVRIRAGNRLTDDERDALRRLAQLDPRPGWPEPGTYALVAAGLARVRVTLAGDDVELTPAGRLLAGRTE